MRNKSLLDIYILQILNEHACEKKRMTQKELEEYLLEEYEIEISRKTLGLYVNELADAALIVKEHGLYRVNDFNDHEIRLLIDGVLFGKHVPAHDARELIRKLKNISYLSIKDRVKHVCYVERLNRTANDKLYEIIDLIDEAIEQEKRIRIMGCKYDRNGQLYDTHESVVDPYYLVTEQSRYYLICYAGRNDDLENRRLDRISHVEILEEHRMPITDIRKYRNGFDLSRYIREHIYMFQGTSEIVVMAIDQDHIGDFIDWYGADYTLIRQEEEQLVISFSVNTNAFYYWALQYGGVATVLKPESFRRRIREGLKAILKRYQEDT